MTFADSTLDREIDLFVNGSASGLLQLLVAAARRSTFQRVIACPTYPAPARTAGLSRAVEKFRAAMRHPDVHPPTFLARLYSSAHPLAKRKEAGQFFTAWDVAEWVLSIAPPSANDDVCDAGAGTAVFADAIVRTGRSVRSYTGVESDATLALCAAHALDIIDAPSSFKVWYANFLLLRTANFIAQGVRLPTLVIANPPFVRFHNLAGRARIVRALRSDYGSVPSSFSGSGGYFLSKGATLAGFTASLPLLDDRPRRLVFLFPRETAGAAHARQLRDELQRVHRWTWREFTIQSPQTGVDKHQSNALALCYVFQQNKSHIEARGGHSRASARVGDYIEVKRGISTGCNQFFVLNDEEAQRRKLPAKCLLPVLPTRIPLKGTSFTRADWDLLRTSGHPCWLLTLPDAELKDFETAVQVYLKEGVRRGLHTTPTAQRLRKWFSIPVPVSPPDVFVTYLFRGAPRFVVNFARVVHLTNILGGRFVPPLPDPELQKDVVDSLNEQSKRWIETGMAVREYRGGLRKIEPKELSKLPLDSATLKLLGVDGQSISSTTPPLFDYSWSPP